MASSTSYHELVMDVVERDGTELKGTDVLAGWKRQARGYHDRRSTTRGEEAMERSNGKKQRRHGTSIDRIQPVDRGVMDGSMD